MRQKAAFLFVGKAADKSLKNAVDALVEDYPDTVFYRKRLERPEIKSLMEQCTCIVCASRDDHANLRDRGPDLRQALHRVE